MREHIFKAKRRDNHEWIVGYYCKYGDNHCIIEPTKFGLAKGVGIIPETLCEFTGLCDKDGKRIFEGDIVKNEYQKGHYQYFKIFYCDRTYMWQGENKYGMLSKVYQMLGTLEVIGNSIDNPELLTAER